MRKTLTLLVLVAAAVAVGLAGARATDGRAAAGVRLVPQAVMAPETPSVRADGAAPACTAPSADVSGVVKTYAWLHCYTAQDIRAAYGVDQVANKGDGQTIVLVDSYGSPTAKADLQHFHDVFFPTERDPNFDEVYPIGAPDYKNVGNGQSGSSGAAGWSGEATLDIEWAYAIAPHAHIVLLAVPPAETEGVQGFPNLFKAIQWAIDNYPPGTVFSQSFGVTEQTFGGAATGQTARFDAVYQAAAAKGDTVLASSGDSGTLNVNKQQRSTRNYPFPTVGWPASSPWVTAVGGTQLQYGWTWNPTSDVPFTSEGDYNPAYFAYTNGGNSEVVWNESWLPAATGGGPSAVYGQPSWQSSVAGIIGRNARGVPDLSWNAAVNGGVLVWITAFPQYQRAGWHVYGGTSASSPQVAGLIALANEQQATDHEAPLGHVAPLLYKVGNGAAFRDVIPTTEGTAASGVLDSNQMWDYNGDGLAVTRDPVSGSPVLPGWDMTTGFGSPRAAAFIAAVRAARNTP